VSAPAVVEAANGARHPLTRFLERFDEFLYFPSIRWDHSWERQQTVITAFAEAHPGQRGRVFPPLGLVPHSPLAWRTWRTAAERLGRVIRPSPGSGHGHPLPRNLSPVRAVFVPGTGAWRARVSLAASGALRDLRRPSGRRLVFATYANDLVLSFAERADHVILDLAERRQENPLLSPYAKRLERELAARADTLVADNRATLADYASERAGAGRAGHYLPQGFSPSGAARRAAASADAPFAYLGNLHHALDLGWLRRLADAHPGRKLRVCGEVLYPRAAELLALPNVEYWGKIRHADIPRFLDGAGWGLIPYKLDGWTAGVFPTKLLEYLDCGVPVLSTAIPEVAQFAHHSFVRICPDPAAALSRPSVTGVDVFLSEHTWAARMRAYGELLLEAQR
jgi:glycosyltransferase involved in cell wall biosynthesis